MRALAAVEPSSPPLAYLASLSPGSRPAQVSALRTLAGRCCGVAHSATLPEVPVFPWHRLDRTRTLALRAWLVERYAPATANRHLAALRGVLRECWRAGLMPDAEYHRAADVPGVKSVTLPAGREIQPEELARLFRVLGRGRNGVRSRAILACLTGAGLRRSEVAALEYGDVDLDTGELQIRAAKGGRDRIGWLGPSALRAVAASPPPFGLTDGAIYKLVTRGARRAGLEPLTPHDFRRTYITQLLERGADLAVVSALAGHSDVSCTARYDRRGERAKKAAAALLEV